MNFIARIIAEIIQVGAFVLTGLCGFMTWRAWVDLPKNGTAGDVPLLLGVPVVLFFGGATVLCLAFFLLASTCRAILETARNTERMLDEMERRNQG